MTCKEKLMLDHPEWSEAEIKDTIMCECPNFWNIPIEAPYYCNGYNGHNCTACWNRKIPGTEKEEAVSMIDGHIDNEKPAGRYPEVTREDYFREITTRMVDVYVAKNHDYGNSFAMTRGIVPGTILVRLYDKLNRLRSLLIGGKAKVKDESIADTLLDLANYAVMELVEMEMEKQRDSKEGERTE